MGAGHYTLPAVTDLLALVNITPPSIAFQIGPVPVFFYGICYAIGLGAAYLLMTREASFRGLDPEIVGNGLVIVAAAALVGGRAYHVIDQWQLYKDNPLKIFLPPYSGLGVYGGLVTGTIAAYLYLRWQRQPFWRWTDAIAPALFLMQAIGRWGNFFNQELYGPPTTLPWAITIDCNHRIAAYSCAAFPFETTGFQPLFLYESISGLIGCGVLLWLGRRYASQLRPGDLLLIFFIWYAIVRFALEFLRTDNWRLEGIPTAQIMSIIFVVVAFITLLYRHRRIESEREPDDEMFDEPPLDEPPFGKPPGAGDVEPSSGSAPG
jgi:phosphatidylglycerol---prolipoprotein diacylglyceryl transferase